MGEVWFGAARGVGNVLGVFVGTGIGAGVVVDGKMYLGAHGGSGEIGHVLMQRDGPECGCGRRGCLEALASRTAIERDIRLEVEDGRMSVLGDRVRAGKRLRSGRILTALEEGDSLTTEIVNRASSTLGTAIGSVVNVLDPDLVVLGGGLVEACGLFMMPVVIEAANARMMPVPGGPVPIVPSQLGDNAGILGATALAFEALNVRKPGGATAYAPVVEWVADSEVIVNGERRVDDFFIRADGKVRKRKRRLSRAELGTDRGLSAAEAQFVCQGRPSVLIVGAGERGQLQISNDARSWLESQGIRLVNAPTRAAITEYRVRKGPRALLLYLRDS
jgi:glucokinase